MEAPIKIPKRSFINNKQAISFFSSLVLLLLHFFLTLIQTLEFWNIFSSSRFRVSVVSSLFSIHLTLEASLLHHIFHTHHLLLCSCSNEVLCIPSSPAPVAYVLCVLFVFIFIFFSFKHFVDSHFLLLMFFSLHFILLLPLIVPSPILQAQPNILWAVMHSFIQQRPQPQLKMYIRKAKF